MSYVRVSTLNLWCNEHEWEARARRVATFLADENIDVLCVQEVAVHDGVPTSRFIADLSGYSLATPETRPDGSFVDVGVLTRLEHGAGELFRVAGERTDGHQSLVAATDIHTSRGPVPFLSAHFVWGSLNGRARLEAAQGVVSWIDTRMGKSEQESPAILAGDLNAEASHDAIRYLLGQTAYEPQTLWTDAWCRPHDPTDSGVTSSAANAYARFTASTMRTGRDAVITADLLPERRIDYVLSRGWRHGRAFSPVNTRVARDRHMSDHYAVVTDLMT